MKFLVDHNVGRGVALALLTDGRAFCGRYRFAYA